MIDADVDPAGIPGEVIDAIRDGLLAVGSGEEAVILDADRVALGAPLPAGVGSCPSISFFLASTLMTGSPSACCALTCS